MTIKTWRERMPNDVRSWEASHQCREMQSEIDELRAALARVENKICPGHGEANHRPEFDPQSLPQRKDEWKGPYVQPHSSGSISQKPASAYQGRSPEQQADNEIAAEIIAGAIVILCALGALCLLFGLGG